MFSSSSSNSSVKYATPAGKFDFRGFQSGFFQCASRNMSSAEQFLCGSDCDIMAFICIFLIRVWMASSFLPALIILGGGQNFSPVWRRCLFGLLRCILAILKMLGYLGSRIVCGFILHL